MNTREKACGDHASACVLVIGESPTPRLTLAVWNEKHKCFGLPGGKREEEDTSIRNTAIRELAEETTLGVYPGDSLVWLYEGRYESLPTSDPKPREVHLYYVSSVLGYPNIGEPGATLAWMPWSWLLRAAPAFRKFYEEALPDGIGHLKSTVFR